MRSLRKIAEELRAIRQEISKEVNQQAASHRNADQRYADERSDREEQIRIQKFLNKVTVAGAGLAFAAAIFTYRQWQTADDTLRIMQKAQVTATKVLFHESDAADHALVVSLVLNNSGHVPSEGLAVEIFVTRRLNEAPNPVRFGGDNTAIPPATDYPLPFRRVPFTDEERQLMAEHHTAIGLGGTIYYGNGFGKIEKSAFCFQHIPDSKVGWIPCDVTCGESKDLACISSPPDGKRFIERYKQQQ